MFVKDFGGTFLTTEPYSTPRGTLPGISAFLQWYIPPNPKQTSITFIHGGGGQGAEFVTTSDGRKGWVHVFLAAGYPVFVLDRPGHGRSFWNEEVLGDVTPSPSYEKLLPYFVTPSKGASWPEAVKHTQWPRNEDASHRFMASQGPMASDLVVSQRHMEAISSQLLTFTGRTALVCHSAGGPCAWAMSAIGGDMIAAILAVEPLGYPDYEHSLGRFANGLAPAEFEGKNDPYACPIAIVTGEASWMRDANSKAVTFLRELGKDVEHIRLWERGVFGNGHMMMSESNSDEIAAVMLDWFESISKPDCVF